jgi:hypothetical protein
MRTARSEFIRRYLFRAITETRESFKRRSDDIRILKVNIQRFLQVAPHGDSGAHSLAAIDLICKTCIRLHELGESSVQLGGFIDTARGLALSLPPSWEARRLKAMALQDIGSTMRQIGFDKTKVIDVLRESLREACAIDGAKWGNNNKSLFIKEIRAEIARLEKQD